MIVSASYRTDIPAFYGKWFRKRLEEGEVRVRNPYGGPEYRVSLTREDVSAFVFWTKNARPFVEMLGLLADRGFPFVVQYTVTGYPTALERSAPPAQSAIADMAELTRRFGSRVAVWRYDPILVTDATPFDWHEANFAALARKLCGIVDEVTVSWAQIYRKTARNLEIAAKESGNRWEDPAEDEKRAFLSRLGGIAADYSLQTTLCSQPRLLTEGVAPARCIDAARLSEVAGTDITARQKGNRPGCLCAESRDIGAYDSCPMGCAYCYAVSDRARAQAYHGDHDPETACL